MVCNIWNTKSHKPMCMWHFWCGSILLCSYLLICLFLVYSFFSDDSSGHFHRQLNASSTLEYEPIHANVALLKAELKAITNDRDILRRELSKMQSQLESYQQLGFSSVEKLAPNHSYEWLKSQCDQAMSELQSLKELHSDTVCIHTFIVKHH